MGPFCEPRSRASPVENGLRVGSGAKGVRRGADLAIIERSLRGEPAYTGGHGTGVCTDATSGRPTATDCPRTWPSPRRSYRSSPNPAVSDSPTPVRARTASISGSPRTGRTAGSRARGSRRFATAGRTRAGSGGPRTASPSRTRPPRASCGAWGLKAARSTGSLATRPPRPSHGGHPTVIGWHASLTTGRRRAWQPSKRTARGWPASERTSITTATRAGRTGRPSMRCARATEISSTQGTRAERPPGDRPHCSGGRRA